MAKQDRTDFWVLMIMVNNGKWQLTFNKPEVPRAAITTWMARNKNNEDSLEIKDDFGNHFVGAMHQINTMFLENSHQDMERSISMKLGEFRMNKMLEYYGKPYIVQLNQVFGDATQAPANMS